MKSIEALRKAFERWWGSDELKLSFDDDDCSMTITYPDPRARRRRKIILKVIGHPVTQGIASAVVAGFILKTLGLV